MGASVEDVKQELFSFAEERFDWTILSSTQIKRGWLNNKWIVETTEGRRFIKQYHPERYSSKGYEEIRLALRGQAFLHQQGLRCPKPYPVEGEYLLRTPSGEYLVVLEAHEGELFSAGKVPCSLSRDLGKETGKMHMLLEHFEQRRAEPVWIPSKDQLRQRWKTYWERAQERKNEHILLALDTQRSVIEQLNMTIFDQCEQGWAHSDLWVDNLLFIPEKLSAILDFDRLRYIYPELDVARAVLSCAYGGGRLDPACARAFVEGYRENKPFARGKLVRALKLCWCLESTWWITPEMDQLSPNPARFAEEMNWIGKNWHQLGELLGDI